MPPATIARLGLERGPSRGSAAAPVSIVVFTDVECKYCGGAIGVLDQLLDDYDGKIRIVVKQMPLQPKNEVLSEGLYAALAQGKFFINGHRVVGLRQPADFHAVIDRALAEKR